MKRALLVALLLSSANLTAQQPPDIGGTWVATTDTPTALPAAPSAIMGAKFAIAQSGKSLTLLRPRGELVMSSAIEIGGPEAKTIVPGATCFGDSLLFETATLEADAIVIATTGTQAAGAAAPVKFNARRIFRRLSADTLLVEASMNQGGQSRQVGTVYRKSNDAIAGSPRPAAPMAAGISAVQWIGGTWSTAGVAAPPPATTAAPPVSAVTEERWTSPAGGVMLAVARGVRGTTMPSFEFLCIAERAGGLVYTAMPNGRTPATDFMLTSMTDTSATFENPAHDFPKKIRYSLTPEGMLLTEVSGAPGSRVIAVTLKKQ
jgi:hypothetical protein